MIVEETDEYVIIDGYGVVFDSTDVDGEVFTKDTEFDLECVPGAPVYLDHGIDTKFEKDGTTYVLEGVKSPVGRIVHVKPTDIGLYFQLKLEKANQYWELVRKTISNRFGFSSGTAGHLIRKENGVYKTWKIVELSITGIPAEPMTILLSGAQDGVWTKSAYSIKMDDEAETTSEATIEGGEEEKADLNLADSTVQQVKNIMDIEEVKGIVKEEVRQASAAFSQQLEAIKSVTVIGHGLVSDEKSIKGLASYVRTGSDSALKSIKANDTIGNETTAADGGVTVPTGHYGNIVSKRSEKELGKILGCMVIPGKGLTVNVPADNSTLDGFTATSEQIDNYSNVYTRNFPALVNRALTLAKHTTKIPLTEELMDDEDSKLMAFIEDYVARDQARAYNAALVTKVLANGTSSVSAAAVAAITGAELMQLEYSLPDEYTDNARWLTRRATEGYLRALQGNPFLFQSTPPMTSDRVTRTLDSFPIHNASAIAAMAASVKSVVFGNFEYVGFREGPLRFIRDPYTTDGIVYLKYSARFAYKVLIPEAIRYLIQDDGV